MQRPEALLESHRVGGCLPCFCRERGRHGCNQTMHGGCLLQKTWLIFDRMLHVYVESFLAKIQHHCKELTEFELSSFSIIYFPQSILAHPPRNSSLSACEKAFQWQESLNFYGTARFQGCGEAAAGPVAVACAHLGFWKRVLQMLDLGDEEMVLGSAITACEKWTKGVVPALEICGQDWRRLCLCII